MGYLENLSPETGLRTLQLLEALAREVGLLPPLPLPQGPPLPTVTTSIGTSARDYATITAWEADLDNVGVYSSGDDAVGECYDDSVFDESVTINGGGTVGLSSITLSVADGEGHDGTAGTGVRIVRSGSGGIACSVQTSISLIEVNLNGQLGSCFESSSGLGEVQSWNRLIAHGMGNANSEGGFNGFSFDVSNSLSYGHKLLNRGSTTSHVSGINFNSIVRVCRAHNCTIHGIDNQDPDANNLAHGVRFLGDNTNLVARNVLATAITSTGTATCFSLSSPSSAVADHNASSDATASGTGSLTNIVTADQYVSTVLGSEDLHLKSGSDCIGAGADLGTTPSGVELDIDGYDRDANGVTWDIGADQFVGSPGAALLLTRTLMGAGL